MTNVLVAVTGATGNVGGEIARRLLRAGTRVRAIARGAGKLAELEKEGAEPMTGSVDDPDFLARAFGGATAAFTMIPPNMGAPDMRAYQRSVAGAYAQALGAAGVGKVVNLSSVGAEQASGTGPIAGLHDAEERLDRLGADIVHLRPTYFMENLLWGIGPIRERGADGGDLRPDLVMAMIATRDIAAVAADLLAAPGFRGKSRRELLGPRDYGISEARRILGAAIGKPDLAYAQLPEEATRQAMLGMGLSASAVDAVLEMGRALNDGRVRPTEPRSAANTTPTTLETFAREVFAPAYRGAVRG